MHGTPPEIDGVTHRYVDVPGVRLHVAEAGEGPPILLLHGWPQHWWIWRKVIPALAEGHRVICPDLRGFGWSEAPQGPYEISELAADMVALLDELGLDQVDVIGHDWGGYVGFLLCLGEPRRIRHYLALGIVHPWFEPPKVSPQSLQRSAYPFRLGGRGAMPPLPGAGDRPSLVRAAEGIAAVPAALRLPVPPRHAADRRECAALRAGLRQAGAAPRRPSRDALERGGARLL